MIKQKNWTDLSSKGKLLYTVLMAMCTVEINQKTKIWFELQMQEAFSWMGTDFFLLFRDIFSGL